MKKILFQFKTFLTAIIVLFVFLPLISAQNKIVSIDGVYIERASHKTSGDDSVSTAVEPLHISETKLTDGDVIVFDIPGFNDYMTENNKLLKNVTLRIDKIELTEFPAYVESSESDVVRFRFLNNNLNSENRKLLYKLPGKALKEVLVGIKLDETNILYYNDPAKLFFKEIKNWGNFGWILIVAFFLFFILLIYRYKSVIKDSVFNLTGSEAAKTYYSFSKSQFAFWTFIIIASFIYIWAFTGDLNSINNTALILLGITSATITTTNLIAKNEENRTEGSEELKEKLLASRIKGPDEKSNFIEDILSDASGVSIHRLQAVVFNLVFGIAFFQSVLFNYTMPEFSETQLIILGLSNGTYAFLKNSENSFLKNKKENQ